MFHFEYSPRRVSRCVALVAFTASALVWAAAAAVAHEGHAALPSKGATVRGNQLLLSGEARKAIGVRTAKVTLGTLHRVLRVNARVDSPWRQQALVTTLVPGKVERVLVRPGEQVAAGQELARIESLELETLQLQMLQVASELELLRQLVEQRSSLVDRGIVQGASLLEANRDLQEQEAELVIVRRKLQALGIDLDTLDNVLLTRQPLRTVPISSPRRGVVAHVDVRVGESVETDEHLFNIVDPSQLLIVGDVLETDLSLVAAGQEVRVTFADVPERVVRGTIDHLGLKIDEGKHTLAAFAYVSHEDGSLRPGQSGRMEIRVQAAPEAILCPVAALVEEGPRTYVLLQQGEGKFLRRGVETGLRTKERVEILDGLFPGDRVIVVGNQLLSSLFGGHDKSKARSPGGAGIATGADGRESPAGERPAGDSIVVTQGNVELPTGQKVFATSAIRGRLANIHAMPGQQVRAGEVLAEAESQELRQLQLELVQAKVRLAWTQGAVERLERLEGLAARKQLWPLEAQRARLGNTVDSLGSKLSLIGLTKEQIDRLKNEDLSDPQPGQMIVAAVPIRAPADGRVAPIGVVPGQVIQPHDKLFEIHNTSTVWVKGFVFERDQARVRAGQRAVVTFPSDPRRRATGTVARTAPVLQQSDRVLPVWIELANPDGFLREGMLARVEIEVSEPAGSLAARRRAE